MRRKLDSGKDIVLSTHLVVRWAERAFSGLSLREAEGKRIFAKRLREQIESGRYALICDGDEHGCKKYRLVCGMWGQTLTFVVLDAEALIIKTAWPSKNWEAKQLEDELSDM